MRTIRTKLYMFEELSEEAKETAIEQVRDSYYEYNDFAEWAIDDCALFEPKDEELSTLFKDEYKFPLLENTRNKIYFNTERGSYLDCENALIVTNNEQFLLWLGIPQEVSEGEDFDYSIFTPSYRGSSTTINFDGYSSDFDDVVQDAIDKFKEHISDCLTRIENGINCMFTDEAIIDDIEANEYEFLKNGTRY
jgi:hypothetical protein